MDIKQEIVLDSCTVDGGFSIRKQNYVEINGQRNNIGQPERRTFAPGQINALIEYAAEMEAVAKALWTPEIIAAWEAKMAAFREQQAAMMTASEAK